MCCINRVICIIEMWGGDSGYSNYIIRNITGSQAESMPTLLTNTSH